MLEIFDLQDFSFQNSLITLDMNLINNGFYFQHVSNLIFDRGILLQNYFGIKISVHLNPDLYLASYAFYQYFIDNSLISNFMINNCSFSSNYLMFFCSKFQS